MSHRQSISEPPITGQLPVFRSSSVRPAHSSWRFCRYRSNCWRFRCCSGPLVGWVRLVYMPKWIRLPFKLRSCQSAEPLKARIRRNRDIWSLTSAFMG